jgi:VIT1/CCC1 family predicted Fe2+/Mn2+ transporter
MYIPVTTVHDRRGETPEERMKSHVWTVLAVVCSALTCGATFLFALYRQLALVEVAASMVTGVELYFLSSSIGDWIEKKQTPSRSRVWIAMGLAAAVVCYFLIAKTQTN